MNITSKIINDILSNNFIVVCIIIVISYLLGVIVERLVYHLVVLFSLDKDKIKRNVLLKSYTNLIASVIKYLIYIFAFLLILSVCDVQIKTIIASAGFIGVLITYIFQDSIKDITNGFFIVFSSPFEIGDFVKISGFEGKVVEMTSRYIVIIDRDSNTCVLNNRIVDNVIIYPIRVEE